MSAQDSLVAALSNAPVWLDRPFDDVVVSEDKSHDTSRCPRCEGYEMETHTYRGECSADPNCLHGIAVDAYCAECDGDVYDIIEGSGRPSASATASTRRGAVLPSESDSAGSIPNGRPDNAWARVPSSVRR